MAYNFGASPAIKRLNIGKFTGVDFASNPAAVSGSRSPDAQNIISDLAGKPIKRTGYQTLMDFPGRINGIHRLKTESEERILIHAGMLLYELEYDKENDLFTQLSILSTAMNDERSTAFQHDGSLYILDGAKYRVYCKNAAGTAYECVDVASKATVPTVVVSMNPDGSGGSTLEDTNVLTNRRTYSFFGTEDATEYHLSADDTLKLAQGPVTVKVLTDDAQWVDKTDFTVNRDTGVITFTTAPGKSPAAAGGVDNVKIEVEVVPLNFEGNEEFLTADLINKCTISIMYGTNGSADRVFISGNPKAPNFQYWSAIGDPCYFPGENFMYLGQDDSAIMGYSVINDTLVVHKEDNQQDKTTFMVNGTFNEATQKTQFAITGSINGVGAISKYCFARLDTEPLFLSSNGVFAITTQYLTAERYAQVRSYYVDPKLTREGNLSEAVAIEYNNYYYLAINDHVYVADGRQKVYEKNAPQSNFQYEWYYLTNIPARLWWEYEGHLYFGTDDGEVKRFAKAEENTVQNPVYNDDGAAIEAYWDTAINTFGTISQYKTLRGFWVMTAPNIRSSIEVYYRAKGSMTKVKETTLDIFTFDDIDFSRFTFNTDDFPQVVATNAKLKKFIAAQFRFRNAVLNEPFGFYEAEMQYTIGGRYKG